VNVSIVVCTNGASPRLAATVAAAAGQAPDAEVVVVWSGAAKAPDALAASLGARVEAEPLPGIAAARQRGLTAATGDVVVFADDDVTPEPGWFDALVAPLDDAGVGSVGGTIVPAWPGGAAPRWLPARLGVAYGERVAGGGHYPFGANMAIRREPALAAGGFRSALGHRAGRPGLHEETELCRHLDAAGWRSVDAPGAVVHHHVRPDQARLGWLLRRAWAEGRSDRARDELRGRTDAGVRLVKTAGLAVALVPSLVRPKAAVYVGVRIAVNAAYLAARGQTRSVSA
jgi:GT2 family glycosyltransferase